MKNLTTRRSCKTQVFLHWGMLKLFSTWSCALRLKQRIPLSKTKPPRLCLVQMHFLKDKMRSIHVEDTRSIKAGFLLVKCTGNPVIAQYILSQSLPVNPAFRGQNCVRMAWCCTQNSSCWELISGSWNFPQNQTDFGAKNTNFMLCKASSCVRFKTQFSRNPEPDCNPMMADFQF